MMQILIPLCELPRSHADGGLRCGSPGCPRFINHLMAIRDIGGSQYHTCFFLFTWHFWHHHSADRWEHRSERDYESNRKKLEESKNVRGQHGFATGLFNRRFAGTFSESWSRASWSSFGALPCWILTTLKLFNDTNGHRIGDSILMELSDFLKTSLRRGDLVFRWGGEEF